MAWRHVGVLEQLATAIARAIAFAFAFDQMRQARGVVLSRVHFRIVIPDPASDLEEADTTTRSIRRRGRVLVLVLVLAIPIRFLDRFKVGIVQFFPVQEPRLLEDAHSLEPVGFLV